MEGFGKIVNGWKPLTIFVKRSILNVWQGFEYASELVWNVICGGKMTKPKDTKLVS